MSHSTSRPQRGVRTAFIRKGYSRLARAGFRVRMALKSEWIIWDVVVALVLVAIIILVAPVSAHAEEIQDIVSSESNLRKHERQLGVVLYLDLVGGADVVISRAVTRSDGTVTRDEVTGAMSLGTNMGIHAPWTGHGLQVAMYVGVGVASTSPMYQIGLLMGPMFHLSSRVQLGVRTGLDTRAYKLDKETKAGMLALGVPLLASLNVLLPDAQPPAVAFRIEGGFLLDGMIGPVSTEPMVAVPGFLLRCTMGIAYPNDPARYWKVSP